MTRAGLAQETGLAPETVGRALRRLAEIGAAHKATDRFWYRVINWDPDQTAEDLELMDRMVRRDARLDAEAEEHARVLAQRRAAYQAESDPPTAVNQ